MLHWRDQKKNPGTNGLAYFAEESVKIVLLDRPLVNDEPEVVEEIGRVGPVVRRIWKNRFKPVQTGFKKCQVILVLFLFIECLSDKPNLQPKGLRYPVQRLFCAKQEESGNNGLNRFKQV